MRPDTAVVVAPTGTGVGPVGSGRARMRIAAPTDAGVPSSSSVGSSERRGDRRSFPDIFRAGGKGGGVNVCGDCISPRWHRNWSMTSRRFNSFAAALPPAGGVMSASCFHRILRVSYPQAGYGPGTRTAGRLHPPGQFNQRVAPR